MSSIYKHIRVYYPFWAVYLLVLICYIYLFLDQFDTPFNLHPKIISKTPWNTYLETFKILRDKSKKNGIWVHPSIFLEEHFSGVRTKLNSNLNKGINLFSFSEKWVISTHMSHPLGRKLSRKLNNEEISAMTALMINFLYEIQKGDQSKLSHIIPCLPSIQWVKSNGIFSIPTHIYKQITLGTSIENEQNLAEKIINETESEIQRALNYFPYTPNIEEIRWAYSILKTYSYKIDPNNINYLVFLLPMFFVRKTYTPNQTTIIHKDDKSNKFLVRLNHNIQSGSELTYYDSEISIGSMYLYRGLWLTDKAPMKLCVSPPFQLENFQKEFIQQYIINGGSQICISIWKSKSLNYEILSTVRLLFYTRDIETYKALKKLNWFDNWPYTTVIQKSVEKESLEWILNLLKSKIETIIDSNQIIKNEFSKDNYASNPIAQIRQAELNILNENYRNFQHLLAISYSEELYDLFVLKESEIISNLYKT